MGIKITLNQILAYNPCNTSEGNRARTPGWLGAYGAKKDLGVDTPWELVDGYEHNPHEDVVWALQCLPAHYYWDFVAYCIWCSRRVLDPVEDKLLLDIISRIEQGAPFLDLKAGLKDIPPGPKKHICMLLLRVPSNPPIAQLVSTITALCLKACGRYGGDEVAEKVAQESRFKKVLTDDGWVE